MEPRLLNRPHQDLWLSFELHIRGKTPHQMTEVDRAQWMKELIKHFQLLPAKVWSMNTRVWSMNLTSKLLTIIEQNTFSRSYRIQSPEATESRHNIQCLVYNKKITRQAKKFILKSDPLLREMCPNINWIQDDPCWKQQAKTLEQPFSKEISSQWLNKKEILAQKWKLEKKNQTDNLELESIISKMKTEFSE